MAGVIRHDFDKLNRLPPYVLSEVIELMKAARREGEDIIDLGMGNPDLPTPPHVVEKICEAASNPRNHRYSESRGIPKLRRAVTEWYQRRHGVELDPDPGLTVVEIINAAKARDIRGMYIMGENPAMSDPDLNHARKGLASLQHLVLHQFLSLSRQIFSLPFD